MRDQVLVSATVVTDDETGAGDMGEFDFTVPALTIDWLDAKPERAEKLARWLEWLAGQCRAREQPFNRWTR